ncbi:MAG: 50S ribosomal protein L6 [Candidatus Cloacimonadales bacterium]
MSRIGKTPIAIPDGVTVEIKQNLVKVSGKLGKMEYSFLPGIGVSQVEKEIIVTRSDDSREQKSVHGLTRSLINNMIIGVSAGYEKKLQVIGTGFTAEIVGPWLKMGLGYSHDILMEIPENLTVAAETVPRREQGPLGVQAKISVKGYHKEDVSKFAAEIRKCRMPENYKGKGVRYEGEYVQIKAGKTTA